MIQTPYPGEKKILLRGDSLKFSLETGAELKGQAYLRTNLGRAAVKRNETVAHTELGEAVLHRDWHDQIGRAHV